MWAWMMSLNLRIVAERPSTSCRSAVPLVIADLKQANDGARRLRPARLITFLMTRF